MNKFITAIKNVDFTAVETMLQQDTKWLTWVGDDGKNALHYLGGVVVGDDARKADASLLILGLLLKGGMDINSVHQIKDGCGFFPATPLWYAYTRGRNHKLYTRLLALGADPEHCMFAIAWYNDVGAAALFKTHGAIVDDNTNGDTPFIAAFNWRRFEIAEWFLQNGADVNAADKDGNTALFYAVKRKYKTGQIQLLLQFGADPDKENNAGLCPKKLAESNRQQKILGLF